MLLGRPRLAEYVARSLDATPGIQVIRANPVTGRLLLRHDPDVTAETVGHRVRAVVTRAVALLHAPTRPATETPVRPRRRGRLARALAIACGAAVLGLVLRPSPLVGLGLVLLATAVIIRRAWVRAKRARGASAGVRRPLLRIVGRHRGRFYLATVLSALGQVMDLMLAVFIGWVAVVLIRGQSLLLVRIGLVTATAQLWLLAGLAALVCVAVAVLSFSSGLLWRNLAHRVRHDWRTELHPHVQRLSTEHVTRERGSRIAKVLTEDIEALGRFLATSAHEMTQLVTSFLITVPAFLIFAPGVAWIAFLPVPVIAGLSLHYQEEVAPHFVAAGERSARLNSQVVNAIEADATVKSFCAEDYEIRRIAALSEEYRRGDERSDREVAAYAETVRGCATVSLAGILLLGGRAVLAGPLRFEVFSTLISLPLQVLWKLRTLGDSVDRYQRSVAALDNILRLRGLPTEPNGSGLPLPVTAVRGEILLRDITFAYPDRPPVLRNLSLRVAPHRVTAIVGTTGSGKTTIAKLLLRFQHPDAGTILLDGKDISTLRLRDLRQAIGFVAQDAFLFDGTITDNIAYGTFTAPPAAVHRAAEAAEAAPFIHTLPEQYATTIGERGATLSTGQRQRLSLARAMLKDAPILILDEATSAVDNETEAAIQRALHEFARDRTLLVIAHRLSTIRQADHILVLDRGGVVAEEGTHDELLTRDGLYASLWRLQVGEADTSPSSPWPGPPRSSGV
ncbi:ABC transporter ATP-binding protein [Crossiella sp. CA198]|uniref:ABC transporter ATP-binding protein n=1 Tax=Crossiella sp. CA198 TaxID=3455607 RepID=UPI003F8D279B